MIIIISVTLSVSDELLIVHCCMVNACFVCVCKNVGVLFLLVCVLIPQLLGVDIIYCSNINNAEPYQSKNLMQTLNTSSGQLMTSCSVGRHAVIKSI